MTDLNLSDKALSVLTFAAYHSLLSGEQVKEVVIDDGNGHLADADGLQELTGAGMIEIVEKRGRLTENGLAALETLLASIRGLAGQASS